MHRLTQNWQIRLVPHPIRGAQIGGTRFLYHSSKLAAFENDLRMIDFLRPCCGAGPRCNQVVRIEDIDVLRQLYYVVMTRARQTLTLCRSPRRNPFLDRRTGLRVCVGPVPGSLASSTCQSGRALPQAEPLGDMALSFAGYHRPGHSVHQAIAL